jgi:hypothetical protein
MLINGGGQSTDTWDRGKSLVWMLICGGMVRVYGFSVSQIPSESLLYTIKSPLAKDTNTLLSKYLKIEYIHCILPDLIMTCA